MPLPRSFDLNLRHVFVTLMRERHVTRAALKLHLSQPAISHALKRLREGLNNPLFVRTEQGMQPTPRAEALLPTVPRALALLEEAPPAVFAPATSARHFTLATTDYFEEVMRSSSALREWLYALRGGCDRLEQERRSTDPVWQRTT